MSAIAKSAAPAPISAPAAGSAPVGAGEPFAALFAGEALPDGDSPDGASDPAKAEGDKPDEDRAAPADPAMLLPLLDQQRLLQPVVVPPAQATDGPAAVQAKAGADGVVATAKTRTESAAAMPVTTRIATVNQVAGPPELPQPVKLEPAPSEGAAPDLLAHAAETPDGALPTTLTGQAEPKPTVTRPVETKPLEPQSIDGAPAPARATKVSKAAPAALVEPPKANPEGVPVSQDDPAVPGRKAPTETPETEPASNVAKPVAAKAADIGNAAPVIAQGTESSRKVAIPPDVQHASDTTSEVKLSETVAPEVTGQLAKPAVPRPRVPLAAFARESAKVAAADEAGKAAVAPGATNVDPLATTETKTTTLLDLRSAPLTAPAAPRQDPAQAAPAQPNLGAALADKALHLSKDGAWIDQLARDIANTSGSDGAMRFRLAPEHLGTLRVEITQSDQGAHVRLHASSEAARQALSDAQPKLVAEARAQGVRIADTQVSYGGEGSQASDSGARQRAAAPQDVPLRTIRAASSTASTSASASEARRRDRYA
jgi:flagellar hook-length control protein FliK